MRFKPPPPNSDIGWRVEFRPMEVRHVLPLRSSLLTTPHPPNVLLRGLWVHLKAVGIQMCLWIATPKATGSWYQSMDLERGLQPQRGTMKVLRNNAVWRAREGEAGADSRSLTVWSSPQVQLTDFENSAYVVFVVLLTRVILSYKLDFLIPLSKVMMGG